MNAPATALTAPTEPSPLAPADFIAAMGECASGVNVITTDGPAERFGVSAMSLVSAEPPLLLVCVHRNNLASKAIDQNGCVCVDVLEVEQQRVAQVFAGQIKLEHGDRFACADWTQQAIGAPLLSAALASFACHLGQRIELGTHTRFVGRVAALQGREGV